MKDLFTVMTFTMKDMLKRKSFIISTIILLVMIIIGFNIPNIIKAIKGEEEIFSDTKLLIIDSQNIFENTLVTLNEMELGYDVTISNEETTFEQIKEKIESEEFERVVVVSKIESEAGNVLNIECIMDNLVNVEGIPETLINTLTSIYNNIQISKLNLSQEQLESINPIVNVEMKQTEEEEVSGNVLAMMLLSIVLFYAIFFCASQVSTSITTEKTSKIMETLVTSTTPRTIILGKTIGIGLVGLLQIVLLVGTAIISATVFLEDGMLDGIIDVSTLTPGLAIITILYFILGYGLYSLVFALTGSTVSKPEDIQSANAPASIIGVIGFYLAYFTLMNPTSELNTFAAYLPISSPFCMPLRIIMGISSAKEVAISLLIILVTMLLIAKVSIKIYSQAILNYGSKMSFKDMIKLYKNKNV